MFTGIIETVGEVVLAISEDTNLQLEIKSEFSNELKIDQSVAHNGVCLTVVELKDSCHVVTAVKETLEKSNIGLLKAGSLVNLERCMKMDGRLDGHMVYGHVDTTAECISIKDQNGSWVFTFQLNSNDDKYIVEKGSVAINGTSLTVFEVSKGRFSIAVIPYTFEHTSFKTLKVGEEVNIEFDIIGKYVEKMLGLK